MSINERDQSCSHRMSTVFWTPQPFEHANTQEYIVKNKQQKEETKEKRIIRKIPFFM